MKDIARDLHEDSTRRAVRIGAIVFVSYPLVRIKNIRGQCSVPLTTEGKVVLMHQYRHPIGEWLWEIPTGAVDDGEELEAAARRELAEEIGSTAKELEYVRHFFSAGSISNLQINVFLTTRVQIEQSAREATELIETKAMPIAEVLTMARQGKIKDGQSALALIPCEPLLSAM